MSGLFYEDILPHHISGVQCLGNETELLDCPFSDTIESKCGQRDDAGVVCQGNECLRKVSVVGNSGKGSMFSILHMPMRTCNHVYSLFQISQLTLPTVLMES